MLGEGDKVRTTRGADLKAVWKRNLESKAENLEEGYAMIPLGIMALTSVSSNSKILYAAIMSYVRKRGFGRCNPSYEKLTGDTGMSRWQVGKAVDQLVDKELIEIVRNGRSFSFEVKSIKMRNIKIDRQDEDKRRLAKRFKAVKPVQEDQKAL